MLIGSLMNSLLRIRCVFYACFFTIISHRPVSAKQNYGQKMQYSISTYTNMHFMTWKRIKSREVYISEIEVTNAYRVCSQWRSPKICHSHYKPIFYFWYSKKHNASPEEPWCHKWIVSYFGKLISDPLFTQQSFKKGKSNASSPMNIPEQTIFFSSRVNFMVGHANAWISN